MILPEIGQRITVAYGLQLCKHFQLDYLAARIAYFPNRYRPFVFDGCSGVDDKVILKKLFKKNWKQITFLCCLIHDLRYAYGDIDNENERKVADMAFYQCLRVKAKFRKAWVFYALVRLGGGRWLKRSFSWGFASKEKPC